MTELSFEQSISRLEEIVGKLENGDSTLDESLELFDEGIKLSKRCQNMLDKAQKKVSVLVADESGVMEEKDFLSDEEK